MRRLLVAAALSALVLAKPELYKETEDFQYSRSSSDEGSKSGFYGAQRGNMGGNYEKAHNMDGLAQHQMGGLVRQIDGELGDGHKTRTGSVYTAANSRGIYGSGNYDLSNLQGRNFEETESFGDASLRSSSMSQSAGFRDRSLMDSGAYSNRRTHASGYRQYQAGESADQLKLENNLQSADRFHSAHGYNYESQAAQLSNSGFQSHRAYDQSNANSRYSNVYGSNTRNNVLAAAPVRIVVRPGTRVMVPLTAEAYDASHATSSNNRRENTDAELLSTRGQQSNIGTVIAPKHYESSYSYRKKWEKHDTQPIAVDTIPTVNPFASQNELLEGEGNQAVDLETSQHRSLNSFNSQASNAAYAANTKSAESSQSRYQTGYNTQHSRSSGMSSNGYGIDSQASNDRSATINTGSANLVELLNTKPKSYHSSYSYHKAWERQGDPYVIQPVGRSQIGQTSQKLTAASLNQGAYSSHYGSQYKQAHQSFSHNGVSSGDCDEEGHVRLARSYDPNQEQQFETYQNQEEFGQQIQSQLENLEDLGQHVQGEWDNLQDLGQQTQEHWGNLEQQNQNQWDKLQNLGQQTQENFDKIEDLGQQTETKFDQLKDIDQQSQWSTQGLGQQVNGKQEDFQDLGQQTQEKFDKLEDLGQQSEDLGQQSQTQWDNLQTLGEVRQNQQNNLDLGQQLDRNWDNIQQKMHQSQSILEQQLQPVFWKELKEQTLDNFHQQLLDSWKSRTHFSEKEKTEQNDFHNFQNQDLNFHINNQNTYSNNKASEQNSFLTQLSDTQFSDSNYFKSEENKYQHSFQEHTNEEQYTNIPTSLSGLWDKIDNIAKNSLVHDNDDNITHTSINKDTPSWTQNQETNGSHTYLPSNTGAYSKVLTADESDIPYSSNKQPNDIGRGDIGPEDTHSSFDTSDMSQINKLYKTPQEIEALSLTQKIDETSSNQDVKNKSINSDWLNNDEKFIEELRDKTIIDEEKQILKSTTSTTPKSNNNFSHSRAIISNQLNQKHEDIETSPDENQHVEQQFEDFDQQTQELQKSQFEDFGQQMQSSGHPEEHLQQAKYNQNVPHQQNSQELPLLNYSNLNKPSESHENNQLSQETVKNTNIGITTPQEMGALGLTQKLDEFSFNKDVENQSINSVWLNLDDEKFIEELRRQISMDEEKQILKSTTSTTSKPSNYYSHSRAIINNQLNHKHEDIETSTNEYHMEQQFEDFDQQTQELQKSQFEDFGQQIQSSWHPEEHLKHANYNQNVPPKQNPQEVASLNYSSFNNPSENSENNKLNQETVKNTNMETTTPLETAEPGFWKRVGNKLTDTKNKVYSWFKSK